MSLPLEGKKILLGITGSIAAFKAVNLLRLFIKDGAEVRVVMSPYANKFVTKGTIATLSNYPVYSDFFAENGTWNSHVELGSWADLFILSPLTANTMAKMATGQADNLLVAIYLSAKCPVMFGPAMDLDMYKHPSTQANVKTLQSFGNILIEPETGELASGLTGKGRMMEPERILKEVHTFFGEKKN